MAKIIPITEHFQHFLLNELPWPTSRAGDCSWERRCWSRPVTQWHRSLPKSDMSPKPPLTGHSNANLKTLPRVFAVHS